MYRWSNCTMSPSLISTLDPSLSNRSSRAAEEGSAAHRLCDLGVQWIAEQLNLGTPKSALRGVLLVNLIGTQIAQMKTRDAFEVVGRDPFSTDMICYPHEVKLDWEFNVFTCDEEMQRGVRRYLEEVLAAIDECESACPVVRSESRAYPLLGRQDVFGTSDCIIYDETTQKLWVLDFKFGRRIVSAIDNPQALFYAAGAMNELRLSGDCEVVLKIVQPRVEFADGRDISDQFLTGDQVLDWIQYTLQPAIQGCETPARAEYKIGTWCEFCPAAAMCPLMQKEALRSAQKAFAEDLDVLAFEDIPDVELIMPDADDPDQLAAALKIAAVLEIWTSRVRETADVVGKKMSIPGFKLVRKQTKRRWKNEDAVLQALEESGTIATGTAPTKPLTPNQMEKSGALTQDQIDELSVKPDGGLTLAPDGDRRKAVEPAVNAFPSIED